MEGFRRSFEYVQDYVGMYGLKNLARRSLKNN